MLDWLCKLLCGTKPAATALPPYVNRGGEQVYSQPIQLRDVSFAGYAINAETTALQKLCDDRLNLPGQTLRYHPVAPLAMLGVANCGAITSADPPDNQKGYIEEIDIAFWVLVAGIKKVGGINVVDHVAWFLPYVFVDNAWACASGREIYGFHKAMAEISIPSSPTSGGTTSVDTLVLPTFSPTTKAETQRLLTLESTDVDTGKARPWKTVEDALAEFVRVFSSGQPQVTIPGLGLAVDLFDLLVRHEMPMIFLKQFRDAVDGSKACYQSIVRAEAKVIDFRSGGLIPGNHQLTVSDFASHPIISDLGLAGAISPVTFAAYLDFDFDLSNGT